MPHPSSPPNHAVTPSSRLFDSRYALPPLTPSNQIFPSAGLTAGCHPYRLFAQLYHRRGLLTQLCNSPHQPSLIKNFIRLACRRSRAHHRPILQWGHCLLPQKLPITGYSDRPVVGVAGRESKTTPPPLSVPCWTLSRLLNHLEEYVSNSLAKFLKVGREVWAFARLRVVEVKVW